MNTFPVLLVALCVYAIGYRYYSAFIAAKALALDDRRITPAHLYNDGHNYVPSPQLGAVRTSLRRHRRALARWSDRPWRRNSDSRPVFCGC